MTAVTLTLTGEVGDLTLDEVADGTARLAMTAAERTKLAGLEPGSASVLSLDDVPDSASRLAMTGTERAKLALLDVLDDLDDLPDGFARLAMLPGERTKLAGIEDGAQVNPPTLDQLPDGLLRLALTVAERLKLAGLAENAAANPPSATDEEVVAGILNAPRLFSPALLKLAVQTFAAPGAAVPFSQPYYSRVPATNAVIYDLVFTKLVTFSLGWPQCWARCALRPTANVELSLSRLGVSWTVVEPLGSVQFTPAAAEGSFATSAVSFAKGEGLRLQTPAALNGLAGVTIMFVEG